MIFRLGIIIFVWADLDYDPPKYASCIAGIAGACLYTQLVG
jgi:hypothetical protein